MKIHILGSNPIGVSASVAPALRGEHVSRDLMQIEGGGEKVVLKTFP